ncbi:MAG: hypothetical protein PVI57_07520 [Gemmatimonadota bacterium]|jgi:hypothetical protein
MNIVDLLITIVVVTILVTIVLAVVTYVAYKLRLAREPGGDATGTDAPRYFVAYPPPGPPPAEWAGTSGGRESRMTAGRTNGSSADIGAQENGTGAAGTLATARSRETGWEHDAPA